MKNNALVQNGIRYILFILAGIALALTTINVNSSCPFVLHQDKIPKEAKRLRKF